MYITEVQSVKIVHLLTASRVVRNYIKYILWEVVMGILLQFENWPGI
jgi:hypothetical protein